MADSDGPRLLLIDERAHDRALARLVIGRDMPGTQIREIDNAGDFATALRQGRFDVVVTELQLSWSDGLAILRSVRDARPHGAVVAFTDLHDEELVVEAMKAGFADYLLKSSKGFLQLPAAVQSAWERARNRLLAARSEPWLGTLLDRADIGVYRSTLDGRLLEATPAFLRLLGVESLEEALAIDLPAPHFLSEARQEPGERLSRDRALRWRQIELERSDGTKLHLSLTEMLLLDVDGDMVIDVLAQDVGHQAARERRLRRRVEELEHSNADLSQFATMASHELQEPLRMVQKFGSILAEDYGRKLGAAGGELLQSVVDSADRMQHLIDDLLALSRIDSEGKAFKEVDCNEVLHRAILNLEPAIDETDADIHSERLPKLLGDTSQLLQLWRNLISNAIKFRQEEEAPRIRIAVEERDGEWLFSVDDNGIGLAPDELESIFDIFRRLHPQLPGTGIGLTICRRIVERHGGRLWAERKPERGSRFLFTLPRIRREEAVEESETSAT